MKKIMVTALAAVLSIGAYAQSNTPDTAVLNFVTNATKGGLMEVNSGKLAVKKGKSSDVKKFGAKMIVDHTKANTQLKSIVALKRWRIPQPPATVVQPDAMLTQSSGAEFDRSYINMMVKDHKKTVALFQRAATTSPDPQIKAFATKTLPVLNQHYTMIQQIANKMGIAYEK